VDENEGGENEDNEDKVKGESESYYVEQICIAGARIIMEGV
jgi:hypothetical protein